jgi:hypothetical protein
MRAQNKAQAYRCMAHAAFGRVSTSSRSIETCTALHLVQSSHDDHSPSIAAGRTKDFSSCHSIPSHAGWIYATRITGRHVNLTLAGWSNYKKASESSGKRIKFPRQTDKGCRHEKIPSHARPKFSLQTSRRLWQKNSFISMIPNYTQHIWHEEPTDRKNMFREQSNL